MVLETRNAKNAAHFKHNCTPFFFLHYYKCYFIFILEGVQIVKYSIYNYYKLFNYKLLLK